MTKLDTTTIHTQIDSMSTICKDGKREVKQLIDTLLVQLGHVVPKEESGLPIPKQGQPYWVLSHGGIVNYGYWDDRYSIDSMQKRNNIFLDKTTAEKADTYYIAHRKLALLAAHYNGEFNWKPNEEDYDVAYVLARQGVEVVDLGGGWIMSAGEVFFRCKKHASLAYKQLTDDDKKVLFGGNT